MTQRTYSNMTLHTKSQFTCADKISPFLLIDMATEDKTVLLRSQHLLLVNLTPSLAPGKYALVLSLCLALLCSEVRSFPSLLPSLVLWLVAFSILVHPGLHPPLSLGPSSFTFCWCSISTGGCAAERTSAGVPGSQWVVL